MTTSDKNAGLFPPNTSRLNIFMFHLEPLRTYSSKLQENGGKKPEKAQMENAGKKEASSMDWPPSWHGNKMVVSKATNEFGVEK